MASCSADIMVVLVINGKRFGSAVGKLVVAIQQFCESFTYDNIAATYVYQSCIKQALLATLIFLIATLSMFGVLAF